MIYDNLPTAYNDCRCSCHRQPGVMHFMACCGPDRPTDKVVVTDDRIKEWLETLRLEGSK